MSDRQTPIADALKKIDIPDVEDDALTVKAEADAHDVAVSVEADKDLGQPGGWSGEAVGGWRKSIGWFAQGVLRWRGKK